MNTNIEFSHKIVATAPTTYQLNALQKFHLDKKLKLMNGSHLHLSFYPDLEYAQSHLVVIAEDYFENMNELDEAIDGIYESNSLTIDGVTAKIIELCEEEQD